MFPHLKLVSEAVALQQSKGPRKESEVHSISNINMLLYNARKLFLLFFFNFMQSEDRL